MAALAAGSAPQGAASPSLDQLVLQYLDESGYRGAFDALLRDCAQPYDPGLFPPAQLRRLTAALRRLDESEEEALRGLRAAAAPAYAQRCATTIANLHSGSNVTAVRWVGDQLLSGGADRHLCLSDPAGGGRSVARVQCDAGVVSLDVHQPSALGLAGCMDGSVSVLQVGQGELNEILRMRPHQKYAHCVRWHPAGRMFASCSFDHTICVFEASIDSPTAFERIQSIRCTGVVESIAWTDSSAKLIAAVRGAPHLLVYHAQTGEPVSELPLDCAGGTVITALAVEVSPDGNWITAASENGRTAVLSVTTAQQVRLFASNDFDGQHLCRPVRVWHSSSKYLYATIDDLNGPIAVWDVWNQRIVHTLNGHSGQVRDMHVHPTNGALVTCGFDKSIRIWSLPLAPEASSNPTEDDSVDSVVQRMEL